MKRCFLAACIAAFVSEALAAPVSNYAGQQSREIKALPTDDVQSYLSGKGMGLAKAAELNGYPGPSHVLELATELGLTTEQRRRTEALFAAMQASAVRLGRTLVEEERKLDQLFAGKSVTPELLDASLARIGTLQGKVRGVHLDAHLAQVRILTPEQVARYIELRGYASPRESSPHGQHRH